MSDRLAQNGGGDPSSHDRFRRFASHTSRILGSPYAFCSALLAVVIWAATGPFFGFSGTWQLLINTSTTIVTFLMVFLLQNTQNRDSLAIHLKLDELLRGTTGPRTQLVDLEDLSDEQLRQLQDEFRRVRDVSEPMAGAVEDELGERMAARS